jgi:hypothetical protein
VAGTGSRRRIISGEPGHDRDPARGHECSRVVADALADDAGDPGSDRRAEHVRGEHPAVHDAHVVRAEAVGGQGDGRRHRRDVVEPEQDREDADRHRVVDERQEQQAEPTEGVVHQQQLARVIAVGQPATRNRPDEVEDAHHRQCGCRRGLREAVLDGVRDEMRADDPVRRRAAHEECPGEEPEIRRSNGAPHDPGIRWGWRADRSIGCAERAFVDLGRIVAHEEDHGWDEEEREDRQRHGGEPPIEGDRQHGEDRDEHQLPGAAAGPEEARDQAAVPDEPACGHGRPENARHEARADPANSPNVSVSCQIWVTTLDTRSALPVVRRLRITTRLTPSRPINQPDSGPASPNATRPTAAANDTAAVLQPCSSVIDRRNAPGAARTPAVTSTTVAATATTIQP